MAKGHPRIGWLGVVLVMVVVLGVARWGLERGRSRSAERSAHPQFEGELHVAGLREPASVLRDAAGVPHVLAVDEHDAWFGLGFTHAQDRLGQMQWLVRLARGTTAEVVGASGLGADRQARTLGLGRLADAEAEALDGSARNLLEAYSAGVNARLDRIAEGMAGAPASMQAVEMPVLRWSPAQSLAILKLHAWGVTNSVAASLVLHDLLAALGGVEARPFFPGAPSTLPPVPAMPRVVAGFRDPLRDALGLRGASPGSTAWVVSGSRTASGRPIVGADVHAEPTVPASFHVAHVRGGALDVTGGFIPGLPIAWTGRTPKLAWGSTHARAVVSDLYTERVNEEEGRYHDGGRWRKLEVRDEEIEVRGGEPVAHAVRATRHGPLLDALAPDREPLALAWVGFRRQGARTVEAFRNAAIGQDAESFRRALARVAEPAVAVAYADLDGAGGVQVAGWIPERPLPTELVPVPGRARWFDWGDPIPFQALPRTRLDDERSVAIAADNAHASASDRGEWLWRPGVRAARLAEALEAQLAVEPLRLVTAEALQVDVAEPRSLALVRSALALVEAEALGREASEVHGLLAEWDGHAGADSPGAAVYRAFELALFQRIFEERLGAAVYARWLALAHADRVGVAREVIARATRGRRGLWADREHVVAAISGALRDTWFQLSSRLGASRRKWSWGRLQELRFRPLVPGAPATPLASVRAGGGADSVALLEIAPEAPFRVRMAATFRFLGQPGEGGARFQLAPGQSEHPRHARYADGLSGWSVGSGAAIETQVDRIEASAVERLQLVPTP